MCQQLAIMELGESKYRDIDVIDDLAQFLGGWDRLVKDEDFEVMGTPGRNTCLCPVDLEATATANGWVYSRYDCRGERDWIFDYWYRPGSEPIEQPTNDGAKP